MPSQTFYIFTNPEPWRVPPMQPGWSKKTKKMIVKSGADTMLQAYQDEVRDVLHSQNAYMMEGKYRLDFYFHRTSESETSPNSGKRSRSDATNMQKAIEDALQGVVIENDRDVVDVRSRVIQPARIIPEPFVVVRVEGEVSPIDPSADMVAEDWFDVNKFEAEFERTRGASSLASVEEEWTP